jgi:hypothetical protein
MPKELKLVLIIVAITAAMIYAYDNGYLFSGATGPAGA